MGNFVTACPNCHHVDLGDICDVCDCGDPTNMVGPHRAGRVVVPEPRPLDEQGQNPIIDRIIAYEQGDMTDSEELDLFADLIKTGMVWTLQGSYGRAAHNLIMMGLISPKGDIL